MEREIDVLQSWEMRKDVEGEVESLSRQRECLVFSLV